MRENRAVNLVVGALREALHCFCGVGATCRFDPVCSRYAKVAIGKHGWLVGALLACGRVLRCHPWATSGRDPVPERPFRWMPDSRRA